MNNSTLNYKSAGEMVLKQDETSVVKGLSKKVLKN